MQYRKRSLIATERTRRVEMKKIIENIYGLKRIWVSWVIIETERIINKYDYQETVMYVEREYAPIRPYEKYLTPGQVTSYLNFCIQQGQIKRFLDQLILIGKKIELLEARARYFDLRVTEFERKADQEINRMWSSLI